MDELIQIGGKTLLESEKRVASFKICLFWFQLIERRKWILSQNFKKLFENFIRLQPLFSNFWTTAGLLQATVFIRLKN